VGTQARRLSVLAFIDARGIKLPFATRIGTVRHVPRLVADLRKPAVPTGMILDGELIAFDGAAGLHSTRCRIGCS